MCSRCENEGKPSAAQECALPLHAMHEVADADTSRCKSLATGSRRRCEGRTVGLPLSRCVWRDERPRALALQHEGEIKQQRVVVAACVGLQPNR